MVQSIDRNVVRWEDHILDPSPVELHGGMWFKREDKFAPLGYGGINGSKLRVCIWLISEAVKQGATGIVHGAVTGSPQHPMTACIAAHFGIPVVDCIGTIKITDHETLTAAKWMGASFRSFNPGYAATLNAKAKALSEGELKGYFHLETNITLDHEKNEPKRVADFHWVGSRQVENLPDHIETIIVPAGSCNSVTSVLYGIARCRPKNLKRVVLMGIGSFGSSDPRYVYRRMQVIEQTAKIDIASLFRPNFMYSPDENYPINMEYAIPKDAPYELKHYNVNAGCGKCEKCKDGYCVYNDLMPFKFGELDFHPRYEGKMMHFAQDHISEFRQYFNDKTLFWIVGSKPDARVLVPLLKTRFGDLP